MIPPETNTRIEVALAAENLGLGDIALADIETLRLRLVKVNSLLTNPSRMASAIAADIKADTPDEVQSILLQLTANLIDRKREILNRIEKFSKEKLVARLTQLAETNPAEKPSIQEAQKDVAAIAEITKEREEVSREERQLEHAERLVKIRLEGQTRLAEKLLARESIASMVGALLLLTVTGAFIGFTAFGPETAESKKTLETIALVILGYFFGQAAKTPEKK